MNDTQTSGSFDHRKIYHRVQTILKSKISAAISLFVMAGLTIILINVFFAGSVKKTALFVPPQESIVNITDTGFEPQTIQIKQNTAITWVNTGSNAHQVAADPYPKDDSIPGFDSSQTLLVGDSLTFAFLNKGTYHLHDELNPLKFNQTIVVK